MSRIPQGIAFSLVQSFKGCNVCGLRFCARSHKFSVMPCNKHQPTFVFSNNHPTTLKSEINLQLTNSKLI